MAIAARKLRQRSTNTPRLRITHPGQRPPTKYATCTVECSLETDLFTFTIQDYLPGYLSSCEHGTRS